VAKVFKRLRKKKKKKKYPTKILTVSTRRHRLLLRETKNGVEKRNCDEVLIWDGGHDEWSVSRGQGSSFLIIES
jgi:hypothetical protein